jgi:hypothetical protein
MVRQWRYRIIFSFLSTKRALRRRARCNETNIGADRVDKRARAGRHWRQKFPCHHGSEFRRRIIQRVDRRLLAEAAWLVAMTLSAGRAR